MKKSKTVIALGIIFIISSVLGFKTAMGVDHLFVFGVIFSKTVSTIWYLFWCVFGIIIGLGFIQHRHLMWKFAVVQHGFFALGYALNMILITKEKVMQMYGESTNIDSIRAFFVINIIIMLVLLILIYTQKKAFQQKV